jgi:hypothetical protein
MIPIEQASDGIQLFLTCGCSGRRARIHPTGAAVLVLISQQCDEHVGDDANIGGNLVRSIPKGVLVSPFVRTRLPHDSLTAR